MALCEDPRVLPWPPLSPEASGLQPIRTGQPQCPGSRATQVAGSTCHSGPSFQPAAASEPSRRRRSVGRDPDRPRHPRREHWAERSLSVTRAGSCRLPATERRVTGWGPAHAHVSWPSRCSQPRQRHRGVRGDGPHARVWQGSPRASPVPARGRAPSATALAPAPESLVLVAKGADLAQCLREGT